MTPTPTTTFAEALRRHSDLFGRGAHSEALALESAVLLADATTPEELGQKWTFIHDQDLLGERSMAMQRLIVEILQRDVDRLGKTIPELEVEGIVPRGL